MNRSIVSASTLQELISSIISSIFPVIIAFLREIIYLKKKETFTEKCLKEKTPTDITVVTDKISKIPEIIMLMIPNAGIIKM